MRRQTSDPTSGSWRNHRQRRLVIDALLLGVVGALSAQLFMLLLHWASSILLTGIARYHPPGLPEEGGVLREQIGPYGLWLIPVATTLGGLVSGILVYWLAPEAEGHGTDTAVKAFHFAGGRLRYRIRPLKMIASAITIGSGGAAGREGPIALISAGVGSAYADLGRRTEEERRTLVLVGMAAGLSAIFRSPLGAAVFAIEVLYRDVEYEVRALLYALLAAVVAYTVNGPFVGWEPLFNVSSDLTVTSWADYGWYAVLGVAARVPIATLLMVAEMTGGYSLLVPASLAVVVSYLVQTALSSRLWGTRLNYSSLYEAQVDRRSDSPAHHAEHVQIAMQLLRDRRLPNGVTLDHLDLVTLLRGGIPIDLPNRKQLCIGVVRDDSSCVGQPIRSNCLCSVTDTVELVGVLREGEMLLAHSDQPLQAGDQVLLICRDDAWSQLGQHLSRVSNEQK